LDDFGVFLEVVAFFFSEEVALKRKLIRINKLVGSSSYFLAGDSSIFFAGDDFFANGEDFSIFLIIGDDFSTFFLAGGDFSIFFAAGTSLSSLDDEIFLFFFVTTLIGDASGLKYFVDNVKLVNSVLEWIIELFSMNIRVNNGNNRESEIIFNIFSPFLSCFFCFLNLFSFVWFFGKE
jgi:hypothetical protein